MMRTSVFLLFLLCFKNISAQEKAIAKVHYLFNHVNDTAHREQPLRDEVVVYLGKNSAFYKSFSDERVKESISAQKLAADFTGHLTIDMNTTAIKNAYIIYPEKRKLIDIESISSSFDAYAKEAPYENQQWELSDETKMIGNYLCQKATTTFKGRNYIVWFTSEIPFSFGPWKLHGLPGLILSAHDDKNEVSFEYAGFETLKEKEPTLIEIPFYVISASNDEIENQKKVFDTDQGKYYQVLSTSGRLAIGTAYYGIDYDKHAIDLKSDDEYKPSFQTNNPIEIVK